MEHNDQFNRIYAETRDELLRYLMIRTNADPEAEDLFQEVYRRFYIRISRNTLPILDPKRYLLTIAKKELSRYYRRTAQKRLSEQPIEEYAEAPAEEVPIDEQLFTEERMYEVWQILEHEPELSRRAFLLFYGCGQTQKEIGDALGIEENTVSQRLFRTRQRIRAQLKSEQEDE
ncbi:MAG: sigma-70 family RNA polymerase sigma factor [Clostridia bacterium]|nr:sigma-70 family RNA polymerase sigma factor [Clostridia bacterium]